MVTITYAKKDNKILDWQTQLESLVMAYKLEQDITVTEPILVDNQETRTGYEAIDSYVSELMEFKEAWFACSCG